MAGLKKKKKEKSGSPNIVLVIFLVLFILSNITLGVLFYYSLEEKEDFRKKRFAAESATKAEKEITAFYRLQFRELRTALGDQIEQELIDEMKVDRELAKKSNPPAKDKASATALTEKLSESLGGPPTDTGFGQNYPTLHKAVEKRAVEAEGKIARAIQDLELKKKELADIAKNTKDIYDGALERIDKGNAASLAEAKKRSAEFAALSDALRKANEELNEKKDELLRIREEHENALKLRDRELVVLKAQNKELEGLGGKGAANQATRNDAVPLMLDLNLGRALWDNPVGKVTRVDLNVRQVVINIGSHHGAKPELTFNVFGAGPNGRAEKWLKGSLEIVKILGPDSSLARITSLFDAEGLEISLGLQTRGRILRETEAPLREGDLLYNMFWGSHVAIAGIITLDDTISTNPADQTRSVLNMVSLLERQGMTVDAYVDLTDGQIRGKITNKTRYLILGDNPGAKKEPKDGEKEMPKEMKEDPDKKDPDKKDDEPVKKNADDKDDNRGAGGRLELIAIGMKKLHNDATQKGVLQISSENFLNVIGYRRARNANTQEKSNYRPFLPYAGAGVPAALREPMAREDEKKAPPPDEKKAPDEK